MGINCFSSLLQETQRGITMSSMSLFKQLTAGISFNTKQFSGDAAKFGLVKKNASTNGEDQTGEDEMKKSVELPCLNRIKAEVKERIANDKKKVDVCNDEITVFGTIKSERKKKTKKKKKTQIKELYSERVNQFRNANNIHVTGTDIPDPVDQWQALGDKLSVSSRLVENISVFPTPTPIQMQALPLLLQQRELLACAPTGSGKTAAFLLPLIHQLKEPRNGGYRAVVVVPTKELAVQIVNECIKLCEGTGLRPHTLCKVKGAVGVVKHDILVSPPNRLVYMLNQDPPLLTLDKVEWLVIDEADKLFEAGVSGFREQLGTIYRACSGPNIRRAMFSATLGPEVEQWCKLNLDNLVKVRVGAANSATRTIDQQLLYCGSEAGKLVAFRDLVRKGLAPPTLVFVQTKERAQELFKELLYDGIHVDVIHSDRSEQQRENTVRAFRSGGIWVLICTELLGRGIDFKGVNLVVNYDFPPSAVSYIHRIGRTGRAGRQGKAVTFFTEEDRTILRTIATVMRNSGCEVPEYMLHLQKPSRDKRKDLKNKAPRREGISKESEYDKNERERKEGMVAASKKRKKMALEENEGGEKRTRVETTEAAEENSNKPIKSKKLKKKSNEQKSTLNEANTPRNRKKKNPKKKPKNKEADVA